MKRLWISFLVLAFCTAVAGRAATKTFKLASGEKLALDLPAGWSAEASELAGSGVNLTLQPTNGSNALGEITVLYNADPGLEDKVLMQQTFAASCKRYLDVSVGHSIDVKSFHLAQGFGYYAMFVDARLVGKPSIPGDYKTVTPGLLCLDQSTVIAVTLYADKLGGPDHKALMNIVQSARLITANHSSPMI